MPQYLSMPQWFKASGDIYTRRYNYIIKDVPNTVKIVDDTFLNDLFIEDSLYLPVMVLLQVPRNCNSAP